MEKIRATKLILCDDYKKRYTSNLKLYLLPYKTELTEVTEALGDITICKFAMVALLRYGLRAWDTCNKTAVDNGTILYRCICACECASPLMHAGCMTDGVTAGPDL
jgi:hypothetical protein